jgi:hypothetical protein
MKTYQAMIQVSYWTQVETEAENEEQAREQLEQKGWSQHLNANGDLEIFDLEEVK